MKDKTARQEIDKIKSTSDENCRIFGKEFWKIHEKIKSLESYLNISYTTFPEQTKYIKNKEGK